MFGNKENCTSFFSPPLTEILLTLQALFLATARDLPFLLCVSSNWQHSSFFVHILMTSFIPYISTILMIQFSRARLVILTLCIIAISVDITAERIHLTQLLMCASEIVNSPYSQRRGRHGQSSDNECIIRPLLNEEVNHFLGVLLGIQKKSRIIKLEVRLDDI